MNGQKTERRTDKSISSAVFYTVIKKEKIASLKFSVTFMIAYSS